MKRRVLAAGASAAVLLSCVAAVLAVRHAPGSASGIALAFVESDWSGRDEAAYAFIDPEQRAAGYTLERFRTSPLRKDRYPGGARIAAWLPSRRNGLLARWGVSRDAPTIVGENAVSVRVIVRIPDEAALVAAVPPWVLPPFGNDLASVEAEEKARRAEQVRMFGDDPPMTEVVQTIELVRRDGGWFVRRDVEREIRSAEIDRIVTDLLKADERDDLEAMERTCGDPVAKKESVLVYFCDSTLERARLRRR